MTFDQNIKVLEGKTFNNATFEILELESLQGATSANMAMQLFFAKQQGLKMVGGLSPRCENAKMRWQTATVKENKYGEQLQHTGRLHSFTIY